ncbi:hypothetical protein [Umezakia ovalisporum]|jgi:hypothetical protein|uniref:hypothetical protein n=1 Tax=Umezakia ovalisporum TaxID=75695 RepID=UPI0026800F0C|nr:hypothetical protein [Umezakia ovalisporum]
MKNKLLQILWIAGAWMGLILTGCEQVVQYLQPLPSVEILSDKPVYAPQVTK